MPLTIPTGSVSELLPSVVTGTTQLAVRGITYVLTNASATALTLPAGPSEGDTVGICVANARTDNTVVRNGQLLMGLMEDMTIDNANATVTLRFMNASWRLV